MLTYHDGHNGHVLELGDAAIEIGRHRDCAIRAKYDDTLTRRHACIYRERDRYWIADLGSDNGTYINGARIAEPRALHHRDKIQCGRLELEFFEK